ncbi:MAG: peptidase [Bdellovibrio sp.]|nr:MAG: peptidase [Bdellovibrio sp.]
MVKQNLQEKVHQQSFPLLSDEEVVKGLLPRGPGSSLCFFSTQFMGFTKNPRFYQVPIDDHGFHRGDGVFEALRVSGGRPYLLAAHLQRLQRSCAQIGLANPLTEDQLVKACEEAIRIAGEKSLLLRIFVTRGPGSFSPNPRDSRGAQLYLVAHRFTPLSEEVLQKGVRIGRSRIPAKTPFFARVKSLNYLPNVLMKAEANERGLDYTIGVDESGHLLEGATENLIAVDSEGSLIHPPLEQILSGCTMLRLFELVERAGLLPVKRSVPLSESLLRRAQDVFLIGTTLDVMRVCAFEEHEYKASPWGPRLRGLIYQDQLS